MKLFRNKPFTAYLIAGMLGYFSTMVFITLMNYYFQYILGFGSKMTGFILIISPVIMAIIAPYAGKLSDKIHPQKIATIGLVIITPALISLFFLEKNTPMYLIIFAMILQAAGTGLFSSPNFKLF